MGTKPFHEIEAQVYDTVTDVEILSGSLDSMSTSGVHFLHGGAGTHHIDTLQDFINHTQSSFVDHGFELVDNGNGTVNVSGGHVVVRDANDVHTGMLMEWDTPALTGISLTDNTSNYIWAYHNGTDTEIVTTTSMPAGAGMNYSILYFVTRVGNNLNIFDMREWGMNYPLQNSYKDFLVYGFEWEPGGTMVSSPSGEKLDVTAGAFYLATVRHAHGAFDTTDADTFTAIYRDGVGGWTRSTGQVALSGDYYDDGDGTLGLLPNNNYAVHWVYLILNTPDELVTVFGREAHNTLAEAEAEAIPDTLPPECDAGSTGVLIAKVICQEGEADVVEVLSPFVTQFAGTQPTTHNNLAGLNAGDYVHLTAAEYADLIGSTEVASLTGDLQTQITNNDTDIIALSGAIDTNTDDISFLSGAIFVPAYGSIYVNDNTGSETISGSGWTQITSFDGEGVSSNTTPSSASGQITVGLDGVYSVNCSISFEGPAVADTYLFQIFKDGTGLPELTIERDLSTADVGSGCISGIVSLTNTDVLDLRCSTQGAVNRAITVHFANLNIQKIN